jgi:hypothetical protein
MDLLIVAIILSIGVIITMGTYFIRRNKEHFADARGIITDEILLGNTLFDDTVRRDPGNFPIAR